jgi:ferric-dicitrate binding protein FerR (iron transport regulator)
VSTHDTNQPGRTPEQERAAEAVRGLGAVQPDPDFRARLREGFVTGTLAAASEASRKGPAAPETGSGPGRSGLIVSLFSLAIAASVAILIWLGSAAPTWEYAGASGEDGDLWVCGHLMDPADTTGIQAMLHEGTPIKTTGSMQMELTLPNRLTVQVAPEAEVTVPSTPRRWFGGDAVCEVRRGEVRFVTGREMPGERFLVESPLATIEVTGTTFAVITGPDSTCVCVLEGEVRMMDADGSTHAVPAGERRSVFRDGNARQEEILPMERMKLTMLRDNASPDLKLE